LGREGEIMSGWKLKNSFKTCPWGGNVLERKKITYGTGINFRGMGY